jgi:orotidine-5'-phosphate decarboxylase
MLPQIFIALDTPNLTETQRLAHSLQPYPVGIKLGLEFISAQGLAGIQQVQASGVLLFLDTKFHDIPHTVAKAVDATVKLNPAILNIHASGGLSMMQEAKKARDNAVQKYNLPATPKLIAVTVLTSMDNTTLTEIGQKNMPEQVENLAQLAKKAELDGVVCSPHEVPTIKQLYGNDFLCITPGIRLAEDNTNDQKRITTPNKAIHNGADVLVIGRSITESDDPVKKLEHILSTLK